jgi:hypothetical protein
MRIQLQALLLAMSAAYVLPADQAPGITLRGKLTISEGKPPVVETADHKRILLDGDETTRKVLADAHLNGFEVELKGRFASNGKFAIDPRGEHGMLVRKDGHLKLISYFCDNCSIHYATPGPCVCCQKETTLDLVDPDAKDQ